MKRSIDTECCGRITRCKSGECVLMYVFGGGGKCVRCGWIWDMMPGVEATPISPKAMSAAHSTERLEKPQ